MRRRKCPRDKRLFAYENINGEPLEGHHIAITPYLLDGGALADPHCVVRRVGRSINGMKKLASGTQPIDDGFYTFDMEERASFLEAEPAAAPFLRPYVDARGYLQGGERWILAVQEASPTKLKQLPLVLDRMASVRRYRSQSKRKSTLAIADFPARFNVEVLPESSFLVIPKVSSERRAYVPIGWLEPPTIPSDLIFVLQDASLADFALLTSAMHMAWAAPRGREIEERLPLLHRPRVQHFPRASPLRGQDFGPSEIGTARSSRPRRPCHAARGDTCGTLRPGSHASEPAQGSPESRPCCGPALPPHRFSERARANRAPVPAVREDTCAVGCDGQRKPEAP